jgi:hypothetical protein
LLVIALIPVLMACIACAKLAIRSGHLVPGIGSASIALITLGSMMWFWSRALRQSPRLPT